MGYTTLTFKESLGFEDMDIAITLNELYIVIEEYDGVFYILDDNDNKIGFEEEALDKTVLVERR